MTRPGVYTGLATISFMDTVTVVGNGVAGWSCAKRLAEQHVAVTLIGPGLPHDRPPLSKRALASGRIPWSTTASGLAELGIHHIDGVVQSVEPELRQLTITSPAGDPIGTETFTKLVWATGLAFPLPPISGIQELDVHQNHAANGAAALHRELSGGPRRMVAVIGAGLIGTETAATIAGMGHSVTLVDMADRPLERLPRLVSDAALGVLRKLDIKFLGGAPVASASQEADGYRLTLTGGTVVRADVLVVAAGGMAQLADGLTDPRTTVSVDELLRVNGLSDVWACGDIIDFPHPRWGRITIPHWDHAFQSGRHVADTILGATEPYVRDPYWFSDIGPLRCQLVGHADSVALWDQEDGQLAVGYDDYGLVAAVLLINAPARLAEARTRVADATESHLRRVTSGCPDSR